MNHTSLEQRLDKAPEKKSENSPGRTKPLDEPSPGRTKPLDEPSPGRTRSSRTLKTLNIV